MFPDLPGALKGVVNDGRKAVGRMARRGSEAVEDLTQAIVSRSGRVQNRLKILNPGPLALDPDVLPAHAPFGPWNLPNLKRPGLPVRNRERNVHVLSVPSIENRNTEALDDDEVPPPSPDFAKTGRLTREQRNASQAELQRRFGFTGDLKQLLEEEFVESGINNQTR